MHPRPLRELPALARDLEPRLHGVRPAAVGPRAAAVHQRRHGDEPRADRERRPAGPEQLRHGSVLADPQPDARADGPRSRSVRGRAVQLPGHRGPRPGGRLPHRRRGPARERGPGLRPAPDPPPGGPPRPDPRPARAVHGRPRRRRHRHHGRGVPPHRRPAGLDPRRRRPGGGPVRPDARRRLAAARGRPAGHRRAGCAAGHRSSPGDPPGRRAEAVRRGRLPAPRHVRLPDRPDRRARRRIRRRRRSRGLRRGPRRAARSEPIGQEGGAREARGALRALPGDPGPRRRHDVPRLRDDDRRGQGRRDRPRRDGVRRADRPGRGRGRPRPDAVLRRGRRPGRRSRRAPGGRAADRRCSRSRTPRSPSAG